MIRHFAVALDGRRAVAVKYYATLVDGTFVVGYAIGRAIRHQAPRESELTPLTSAILYGAKGALDTRGWRSSTEDGLVHVVRALRGADAPDLAVGVNHLARSAYGAYLETASGDREKFIVVHTAAADDVAVQFHLCIDDLRRKANG